jgi:RNA ligase (TIGR02306 family)
MSLGGRDPYRKLTLWQRILKFFGYAPRPYGPKNAGGVYDVESLKNYPRVFDAPTYGQISSTEQVIVTEKIHGSNARYIFDGKRFWAGSHKKWWKEQNNIWWEVAKKYPWIETFCRDWPNFTLRGEVTPTQTGYPYGSETEKQFFAFDVQRPEGSYLDKKNLYQLSQIQSLVPVLYEGPYDAAKMKELAEGPSKVTGAKNIREGIVISSVKERQVRGVGRAQLKLKSLKFLEKESK